MTTLDLREAYLLLPVCKAYRKYLRFSFRGDLYEYNAMPFGLNCAPLIFTKLMKSVLYFLRRNGFVSVLYLDDFFLFGDSYTECLKNTHHTIDTLHSLGFSINYSKSNFIPCQQVQHLGFMYNSSAMTISTPKQKKMNILTFNKKFSNSKSCKMRDFARFIGNLISVCPALTCGFLYTKLFERAKFLPLREARGQYNNVINISADLQSDFNWWAENLPKAIRSIKVDFFKIEIFSDASLTKWGLFCNGIKSYGFWSDFESKLHINYLELLVFLFGLRCFVRDPYNCNILCRVDNTTAFVYVNRMGSIQHSNLNELAPVIGQFCEARNIVIFASYIKSFCNIVADQESRQLNIDTEWELSDGAFQKIIYKYGRPEIDIFASRLSRKYAFTINWNNMFFYCFPPFSVILKVLQKIINEHARGIVVVPFWPSQPWYPVFTSLLEDHPTMIDPDKNFLSFNRIPHPLGEKLSLVAGILSCKPCNEDKFSKVA
ncbi:uncharacterized protein [Euwallacea similis]|uniref:uncharacterized protein n=1 Tax=Euwallacea similis TaxID=1736056 RepID=UPI00344EB90C